MSDYIHDQKPLGLAEAWESLFGEAEEAPNESDGAPAPTDEAELAKFVLDYFGMIVPAEPICPNHHSPLDYLAASFFGQEDLLVWACRGGGKTMLAAGATLLDAIFRSPAKIRVLGGSFDQSDRLAAYIRQILTDHPGLLAGEPTRDRVRFLGGSEIQMLAQSQRAVRGQHVQKIRCDEVDMFDSNVWQAVQFATKSMIANDGTVTRGSIEVLSTLHRSGGLMQKLVDQARESGSAGGYRLINWCLWEVIERCDEQRKCRDCPLEEDCGGKARNGAGFFSIDDAITIKARTSRAAWRSEMLCLQPQRDWLVFNEFDSSVHVKPVSYQPGWPLFRAIDFGYRSPLVCLWIQLSPAGTICVIDEYVKTRQPITKHALTILARDPGHVTATYVDPAGRQKEATSGTACTELLAEAGIVCQARSSSIAEGIELVRAALAPATGKPSLVIDPRCKDMIESFNSYHYPPPGASGLAEKTVKVGPDPAIDALRDFFVNRARPKIAIWRSRY